MIQRVSMRLLAMAFACHSSIWSSHALALEAQAGDLLCRVVDVGNGQCCIIQIRGADDGPGNNYYIVYDTGNYQDNGESAFEAAKDLIPDDETIDLMVLSHTDADHVAGTSKFLKKWPTTRVIRTGMYRNPYSGTLRGARKAITKSVRDNDTIDVNLAYYEFPHGATYRFNKTYVTIVSGFSIPPESWSLHGGEFNNAGSIVIRVVHEGKSILLCGDAVGRHKGDDNDFALIATEKYMVDNKDIITIDSDVIIAPHHGADNGSSTDFIKAVSPEYVVFSAGRGHQHPTKATAERYKTYGSVPETKMFRTDLGDHEQGPYEWEYGRIPNHEDPIGDDDVDILIDSSGDVEVAYRQ